MNNHNYTRLPIVIRILGAFGGFLGGGLLGIIFVVITGAVFDQRTVWPSALTAAMLGALIGFIFPRLGKKLAELLTGL
jgi:hypothetical protein